MNARRPSHALAPLALAAAALALSILLAQAAPRLARAEGESGDAPATAPEGAPIDARLTVRGPDGRPAAFARIILGRESYEAGREHEVTATADERGAALLPSVRPGAYPLRAIAADGSAVTLTTVIVDEDAGSPEVRLEWAGTLEVVAAGGEGESLLVPCGIEAQRDDDLEPLVGKCDVPGGAPLVRLSLPAGPYHLAIQRDNLSLIRDDGSPEWDVVIPPSGTARVEVRVLPLGLVTGVVRAGGEPLAGAVIGLSFDGAGGRSGKALVTCDAEGRFRAAALGRTTLRAFPVDDLPGAEATVEVVLGAPLERDLELAPASDLLVRAVDREGRPVPDATAWLFETGRAREARSQALRAGIARFPGLSRGAWTLVVAGRARAVTVTGRPLEGDDSETATVVLDALPPPETGMLFVTLPPDTIAEGALFSVAADDATGWRAQEQTSKGGVARLRLPPGEYTLSRIAAGRLTDMSLKRTGPLSTTVVAGETTAVELPRTMTALLRVHVRGELGGVAEADVHIRRVSEAGHPASAGDVTRAEKPGTPRMEPAPEGVKLATTWVCVGSPGEYEVVVAPPGRRPRTERVHVDVPKAHGRVEADVVFPASRKPCTIRFAGAVALEVDLTDPASGLELPHALLPFDPEERRRTGISAITLDEGPAHLEVRVEGDPRELRRALADVILGEGSDTTIDLPRLGRGTLAAFVAAPPPRSGDLPCVRLEGPCGRLPKEMPGRIVWDRLPPGRYEVRSGEKLVAEVELAEGETKDLGVIGGS